MFEVPIRINFLSLDFAARSKKNKNAPCNILLS
jgi:hypothetical protein